MKVHRDFHARFSACVRHYRYYLARQDVRQDCFASRFIYDPRRVICAARMRNYLRAIEGTHDFKNFSNGDESVISIREIFLTSVSETAGRIIIDIYGNAFLRSMVRVIIGNVLQACKINAADDFLGKQLLRNDAGKFCAPAKGLFFQAVHYNPLFGDRSYYKKNKISGDE